ncbi:MAG: hypothetical protein VR72_04900 [Clostridiaceae bacterium BRH_c20a]|nr:MAG: hypothetical protein VR72_04900 [Clostridiaceae bacterium BRH_c20a]
MDELLKIDLLRERTGVGYKEAKDALDKAGGDVVQALIFIEDERVNLDEDLQRKGKKIMHQVKEIIRKGNVTKIKLKKGDKTVFEFPVNIGVLGIAGAAVSSTFAIVAALGTVAALANKYTLEIERPGGKVETQEIQFYDENL